MSEQTAHERVGLGPIVRVIEVYFILVMATILGYALLMPAGGFDYDITLVRIIVVMAAAARSVWLIEKRSDRTRRYVVISMSAVIVLSVLDMLFAELFGISAEDVSVASTYLLSAVGFLILLNLIQPPNRYRVAVFVLCAIGLIVAGAVLWQLFDIYAMSPRALVLCIVFALAEIGVLQVLSVVINWAYRRIIARRGKAA